jgi:hypothetical protein
LRAAYEAVVNGVVCANGGGEGVVCGWWGEEGGEMISTREERRRLRCEMGKEVYYKSDQDLSDWDGRGSGGTKGRANEKHNASTKHRNTGKREEGKEATCTQCQNGGVSRSHGAE